MTNSLKRIQIILTVLMTMGLVILPLRATASGQATFAPVGGPVELNQPVGQATSGQSADITAVPAITDTSNMPSVNRIGPSKIYSGSLISLDFQNADIHNILRIIGEVSGKNVVISDAVKGKVTLKLKNVPWDQALDIVLLSKDLGVEESNNVLTVYDLATLNRIQAARQAALAEKLNQFKLAPLVKQVFTPKYSSVSAVAIEMEKAKSERGKIMTIGNDIYAEDDPNTLATMAHIFMRVDKVARQILIEARIIEATASFEQALGIKWSADYNKAGTLTYADGVETRTPGDFYTPSGMNSRDSFPGVMGKPEGILDVDGAARLGFGFLNKAGSLLLNAQIDASESVDDARTISSPRIMAANDQAVYIKQGQQIPYTTGSSANTAANVSFKDALMELAVTPHIEENGQIITLDITLTNDSPQESAIGSEPAINKREAKTKLMVKDGETVVIGGIIVDSQNNTSARTPGLHRVPIMGWLFKNRGLKNKKTEMLIFITANIIPVNI